MISKDLALKNITKDAKQRTILSARISFPRQIICLLNESTAHPHLFSNNQMLPIFLNWINCSISMVNDYFAGQNHSRVFPLLANIQTSNQVGHACEIHISLLVGLVWPPPLEISSQVNFPAASRLQRAGWGGYWIGEGERGLDCRRLKRFHLNEN